MKRQKGFTLIELLIVVAIIGIIAAIAIPNLLDAIERSRQKRSVSEIKSIAGAMQTFSTDYGGYPASGHSGDPALNLGGADGTGWVDSQGSNVFIPDYIQAIPAGDGWKVPYTYDSAPDSADINPQLNEEVASHFTLGSLGSDMAPAGGTDPGVSDYATMEGQWNVPGAPQNAGTLQTHCYQTDIVWADSSFLQAPDGKQKKC